MLNITPSAIEKLKTVLAEEGEGNSLRVLVMPSGHGLQYMLTAEKDTEATDDDIIEELSGLKVVVDTDSAPLLDGAEIDYVEELTRVGFVISNPNAKLFAGGGCGGGCGNGGACACGGGAAQAQAGACACGGHGEQASACACGAEHETEAAGHGHEGHAH